MTLLANTLTALPEAQSSLLIGLGLIAAACLSRWTRRRAQ